MACEIGTEYQDIVEARTYSQFNQSTFEDMCRIAAEELDVEYAPVVCNLRNLINFDTLGGVWLELLGRILGIARGLSVEQQDELFALSDYAGTVVTGSPLGGFDADNVTNMAGVLRSFNSLDTGLESDVQYVQNVRAKALLFSADPTVDDIAEFAEAITGKTANVDVSVNFTVTVTGSPEAFTAFEREVLTNLIPVAAGVNLGVS